MYCRKCGARMSEQDRFCPECGTEASKGNTQQDELNGFPGNEQPQENPRMNKKTVIWIWILAAWILLIAIGISAFFIVKGQHVKKQYQSSLEAGDKYLENLDYEKAEDAYLQAIKISPKEKESYEKLIQYYVDHNEIDKAKKIVKKAKKNLPKSESKKIEEKQKEWESLEEYTWVVEPTIEADEIYYLQGGDFFEYSANEMRRQMDSKYAVIKKGDSYGLIGMDGKLNPKATLGYSDGTYYYIPDNWSDEIFENNVRQEYNLSVSGASDKMNYYMSAGYLDDQGIVPNSGFQRYSARLKADYQVKPWLKLGANVSFTHYDSREQDTEGGTSNANIFYASNIMGAIYPMYIRDAQGNIMTDNRGFQRYDYGKKGQDTNGSRNTIPNANPLASYMLDKMKYSGDVVSGKWFADVDIWGGIKAKVNIGVDANNVRNTDMVNPFYGQYSETTGVGGLISVSTQRTFSVNQQYLLTYNKTFDDVHNLDVLAGHENYNYKYQYLYGQCEKLYNPNVPELDNGISNQYNSSYSKDYATEGWLFRVQYDYDGKYFGSASYRRDASSCFHPDNRWGNFWSVGAGWLLNKEAFLENQSWINMLKFKISYGLQGNDNLMYQGGLYRNYYPYQDQFTLANSNGDFSTSLYYKGNKDITWETSHSFNTGFDFTFWGGKLSGSAEYFSRKTTDMLYFKPVAASMGYSRFPENVGSMVNRGVEIDLNSNIIETKDFSWSVNLNLTHFKNKVLELAPELNGQMIDAGRIYREDESMYQLYYWCDKNRVSLEVIK